MSKQKGILHYEPWSHKDISYTGPIVEGIRDFFKSPNIMKAVYICGNEHDFVPMQPFAGFEQPMWTATKVWNNVGNGKIPIQKKISSVHMYIFSQCLIISLKIFCIRKHKKS
jgi:hypothetical protein